MSTPATTTACAGCGTTIDRYVTDHLTVSYEPGSVAFATVENGGRTVVTFTLHDMARCRAFRAANGQGSR